MQFQFLLALRQVHRDQPDPHLYRGERLPEFIMKLFRNAPSFGLLSVQEFTRKPPEFPGPLLDLVFQSLIRLPKGFLGRNLSFFLHISDLTGRRHKQRR